MNFGEWLQSQGSSPYTIRQREAFLRRLDREFGADLPTLQAHQLGAWLSQFQGWTKLTYYGHLLSVWGWLLFTEQTTVNPVAAIRRPPEPRPHARPLSDREVMRVLTDADARLNAWLLLGLLGGLRAGEIAGFAGEHVTEADIRVIGKGGVLAYVPTHPALWALAQSMPREGRWWPGLSSHRVTVLVSEHFDRLGIQGSTHRLRHTYGTRLVRNGTNLRVAQELMRHASLATTAMYLGTTDEERRTAINSLTT